MSLESASLPVVDIAPYLDVNSTADERAVTSHAVHNACRDYGFFYLIGHGIPEEMRQEMLRLGHEFFALPQAEKDEISIFHSMDKVRGYARLGENVTSGKRDVLEGYDIYREYPNPSKGMLRGAQIWPSRPASLRETVLEYVSKLVPVGQALMRAMGDGLGVENAAEAFDELVADPFWGLKFINYPPLSTPDIDEREKGISCGEHTDYGGLTFLLADDHIKSALQVEDKDGHWINADPIPGAYVVNIGTYIYLSFPCHASSDISQATW
jgi:isopenicillin N synthase-like dioxygenase